MYINRGRGIGEEVRGEGVRGIVRGRGVRGIVRLTYINREISQV
jgi:hypothetical protein